MPRYSTPSTRNRWSLTACRHCVFSGWPPAAWCTAATCTATSSGGVAPELHLEIDGRWLSPGYIEKADGSGPLGDVSFFNPFRVMFRHNTADTIEAMNERDAAQLATSAANWWRGVYDCWRWSGAIDAMIMEVGDMLPGPGDDQ